MQKMGIWLCGVRSGILVAVALSSEPALIASDMPKPLARDTIANRSKQFGSRDDSVGSIVHDVHELVGEERWSRAIEKGETALKRYWSGSAKLKTATEEVYSETFEAGLRQDLAVAYRAVGKSDEAAEQIRKSVDISTRRGMAMLEMLAKGTKKYLESDEGKQMLELVEKSDPEQARELRNVGDLSMTSLARTERGMRMLLLTKSSNAYAKAVQPFRKRLFDFSLQDTTGEAADALAMDALVNGRLDELRRFYSQYKKSHEKDRVLSFEGDPRSIALAYLDHDYGALPRELHAHAARGIRTLYSSLPPAQANELEVTFGGISSSFGRVEVEDHQPSWLISSLPSLPISDSRLSRAACEVSLMLKKQAALLARSRVRELDQEDDIERQRNNYPSDEFSESSRKAELERKIEDRQLVGQFAASCLQARPNSRIEAAIHDAEHIYRWPRSYLPGRQNSYRAVLDPSEMEVSLKQIQKGLSEGEAVLEFAVTDVIDFANLKDGLRWKSPRYVGWFIRSKDEPVFLDLGEKSEVEKLISNHLLEIARAPAYVKALGESKASARLVSSLGVLERRVLHPIRDRLRDVGRLTICPDAALWLVPWAAVSVEEGRFLIEACEVSYADTIAWRFPNSKDSSLFARIFQTTKDARPVKIAAPVVLGGADFDAPPAVIRESELRTTNSVADDKWILNAADGKSILRKFAYLKGTDKEALTVAQAVATISDQAPVVLLGLEAIEARIRALKNPEYLVLASHAFFVPARDATNEDRWRSSPQLAVPKGYEVMDLIANPYVRSGLVLSGANCSDQWNEARSADGLLTGLEVALMDLRGTKLVVLSACDSAVGDPKIGEGVAGLRQAFLMAGAKSVVASLWKVLDEETSDCICEMFNGIRDGRKPAEALRAVQLEQIRVRRKLNGAAHPYYWAAFTVTSH